MAHRDLAPIGLLVVLVFLILAALGFAVAGVISWIIG